MKTYQKVALIGLLVGFVLIVVGFALAHFRFSDLSSDGPFETKIYRAAAEEHISSVEVNVENSEIHLVRAQAGENLSVSYEENKNYHHEIRVENGKFSIKSVYERKFFFFNFNWHTPKLTVYLDSDAYDSISVVTKNGAVESEIPLTVGAFRAESKNGAFEIEHLTVQGDMTLSTSNGAIELEDVHASAVDAKTSNGKITAQDVAAETRLFLRTSNGRIEVQNILSADIDLHTSNGAIRGNIAGKREDYRISADTSNGSNNLSDSSTGEKKLTVKTSNGSIELFFTE